MELKTIKIHGKDYVEVSERVRYIREAHPDFRIITEIKHFSPEDVMFMAKLVDGAGNIIATGHAHETKGSSNINKTSYVENCETSSVGRCLAMYGVGTENSIASANEVLNAKAVEKANNAPKPSKAMVDTISKLLDEVDNVDDLRKLWTDNLAILKAPSSEELRDKFTKRAEELKND